MGKWFSEQSADMPIPEGVGTDILRDVWRERDFTKAGHNQRIMSQRRVSKKELELNPKREEWVKKEMQYDAMNVLYGIMSDGRIYSICTNNGKDVIEDNYSHWFHGDKSCVVFWLDIYVLLTGLHQLEVNECCVWDTEYIKTTLNWSDGRSFERVHFNKIPALATRNVWKRVE